MTLSTSQRNELFDILSASGLPPEKFEWEQMAGSFSLETERMRLKRVGQSHYFEINQVGLRSEQEYNCRYTPAEKGSVEEQQRIRWNAVVAFFKKWCAQLNNGNLSRDKWAEIASQFDSARILTHPADEQKFTEAEFQDIQRRMAIFKQKIQGLAFPELYLQLAHVTFDRVAAHAKHLNMFDWKSLFAGTIANLVFVLEMPPSVAASFWTKAKESFDNVLWN